jgi:hypothetical protein
MKLLVTAVAAPATAFAAAARTGSGYGSFLVWLGLEFVLAQPHVVAASAARIPHQPVVAVAGLWSRCVGFALGPAALVFMLGALVYAMLRRHPALRFDLWAAASVVACAWAPHVLLTAASAVAALWGLDHAVMPQYRFSEVRLSPSLTVLKAIVEFGPSLVWAWAGSRGLRHATNAGRRRPAVNGWRLWGRRWPSCCSAQPQRRLRA